MTYPAVRQQVRTLALAVALVFLSSAVAWAQPKTDIVTLLNGDRITGEINDLDRGRLEFETDDAGTLAIEWDNVARLEATRQFEVETSSGSRFLGSLRYTTDRVLEVVEAGGVVSLPMTEVTRITPIGTSFWKRLEGSVDGGFNYTKSSGIATTTLNTTTLYRRPAFVFRLTSSITLTQRDDGTERDDRGILHFSYVRYRLKRLLISGTASLESNESLGLLLRSQVGGLVGLRLVNTNRAQFEFGGGLVFNDEQSVGLEPQQNVEGVGGVRWSYYTYDKPKTTFDAAFQYFPSLSDWGRQRLQLDSSGRRDFWKDVFGSLNVYYTFDSDPPNPDAARTDVGVVISVGWTY